MKNINFSTIYLATSALLFAAPSFASGASAPVDDSDSPIEVSQMTTVAANTRDEAALTVGEVTTVRLSDSATNSANSTTDAVAAFRALDLTGFVGLKTAADGDDKIDVVFEKIVNLGQKVWDLVAKGKPVVNVQTQSATALPQGVDSWEKMEGWDAPKTVLYQMTAKNLYGIKVIDFTYRVLYVANGSYNGKGKYLARIAVQPQNLSVAWGYNFEANAEVPSVMNMGSVESPVGGAEVYVNWKMSTIIKENRGSGSYFVTGDGGFRNSDK